MDRLRFVNSHFKPFAAIGYEYKKVRTNTGNAAFGGSVQFSIPQFGDFFSDCCINIVLSQAQATVGVVPAFPAHIGAADLSESAKAKVSATENATDGIYTKYTMEYVDLAGNVKDVGSAATNFVRYCEYPGQRLFKKVKFEVNGNPLDDYTPEAMMMYQKFKVVPAKQVGWMRLVGQEVPIDAYTDLMSVAGQASYPASAGHVSSLGGTGVTAKAGPAAAVHTARKLQQVVNGPQTPKAVQPPLEMWVPLIFWFNKDVRLSIASVSIPYGQRFITVDIENQANMLFVAPGNLFLRLKTEVVTATGTGKGTAAALVVTDYKQFTSLTPVLATGSVLDTTQNIASMELYINNIFVNPEICKSVTAADAIALAA